MPLINTNDVPLHRRLKKVVADHDTTIGKAVEKFIRIGLEIDALNMSDEELKKLFQRFKEGKI